MCLLLNVTFENIANWEMSPLQVKAAKVRPMLDQYSRPTNTFSFTLTTSRRTYYYHH